MRAAIYVRISYDPSGREVGVENQEAECREFVTARGWETGKVYVDNDISATTGAVRPAFEQLLLDHPEVIVCWHSDRFVRLSSELERVIELGVNVHAIHAGHLDLSTPAGRATAKTITAWAQYEGEQKGERQRLANRRRAADGQHWWVSRPYGLNRDGTLVEREADVVRSAYADLLAGVSLTSMARGLNDAGQFTVKGNAWTQASLRQLLINPRNAGIRSYNGVEVGAGMWEAIVPVDTYRSAMAIFTDPARRAGDSNGRRSFLLTGVAECGVCGAKLKGAWRGRKGAEGSVAVYTCRSGGHVSRQAAWLDDLVQGRVAAWLQQPAVRSLWTAEEDADRVALLRTEADLLRSRRGETGDDYADMVIDRASFLRVVGRIDARLAEIQDELSQAGTGRVTAAILASANPAQTFLAEGVDRRRAVIESLMRVVVQRTSRGYLPDPSTVETLLDQAASQGDPPAL